MQTRGDEKNKKLNSTALSAELKGESGISSEAKITELREKFANDLEKARERAEVRLAEMKYERSYRNDLKRRESAAELRKKAEKEAAIKAEEEARLKARKEALNKEKAEIEARMSSTYELLNSLLGEKDEAPDENAKESLKQEEACEALSEDGEQKAKIDFSPDSVSKNTSDKGEKCKALFAKSEAPKAKSDDGIKIGIAPYTVPVMPQPVFAYPYPPYQFPEQEHGWGDVGFDESLKQEACRVAGVASEKTTSFGAPLPLSVTKVPTFNMGEVPSENLDKAYKEVGASSKTEEKASEPKPERSHRAGFAAFAFSHGLRGSRRKEAPAYSTDAPKRESYSNAARSDVSYGNDRNYESLSYSGYTEGEHVPESFDRLSDVDYIAQGYQKYTEAEYAHGEYERQTDVDYIPQSYERQTDVDYTADRYERHSDVDYANQGYQRYSDAEYAHGEYERQTDVDYIPQSYERQTDTDFTAGRYEKHSDVDYVNQRYSRYSDAEYASGEYERQTDVDYIPQSYERQTDVDYTADRYERYTDVEGGAREARGYYGYEGVRGAYGHYNNHSGNIRDEKALKSYEAMLMSRDSGERRITNYEPYGDVSGAFSAPYVYDADEIIPESYDFTKFDRRELQKFLKSGEKRVNAYRKAIRRKNKQMKKLSSKDQTKALADIVNLNKHIVDVRAVALVACVALKHRSFKKRYKSLLTSAIKDYNLELSNYEIKCGERLPKVPLSLVKDILKGEKYRTLPLVRYVDEVDLQLESLGGDFQAKSDTRKAIREEKREKLRLLKEAKLEEERIKSFAPKKQKKSPRFDEDITAFRKRIERDLLMLNTRYDYLINDRESKIDYLDYSFSVSRKEKRESAKELNKSIKKLKKLKKRALKYERLDSERYYSQLLVTPGSLGLTKRKKIDLLDSLNMRLDALLSERERINEHLIRLYSGDLSGTGSKKTNDAIRKIKRRTARRVSRRFRRDMRVLEKHVPLDIKKKLSKSVNKIIDAEITSNVLKYKLRKTKPRGAARCDMKRKIRESRASIKYYLSDYRRFLKRARIYEDRSLGVKIQIIWIIAVLAVIAGLTVVYIRFRAPINGVLKRALSFIRNLWR